MSVEKVSVYSCGARQKGPLKITRCSGRASLRKFFGFLEGLTPGGDFPIESAIEDVLSSHRGKGIVVLLSDFLTFGDVSRAFNALHGAGLEIYALQVLGPSEINPELAGDLRFVDAETQMTLDISSAGELLGLYHEHRQALEDHLSAECRRRSGRFLSLSSSDDVKSVLFDQLLRRGWVR